MNKHLHRIAAALWGACMCLAALDGRPAEAAATPACPKGKAMEELRNSITSLFDAVQAALTGPQCGAVLKVLAQLQANTVPGGRKLHEGKPLDRAAAKAELQEARSSPEFTGRLAAALEGVTELNGRLVVEAALLDDEGYFSASRLLMEDIAKAQEAR